MSERPAGSGPVRLRDGRSLDVEIVSSDDPLLPPDRARAIAAFIVDPLEPWFSSAEQEFLALVLRGDGEPSLRHALVVGWLDGRIAGTSWHGTSATHPHIGVVAYVRTDASARGLGVASALTAESLRRFWADGGMVAYLGTTNPAARRIYEGIGFRAWNGVAMRADRPEASVGEIDVWSGPIGTLDGRDAEAGDVGAVTHLLVSPAELPWRIRSFSEDVYLAPPGTPISSCVRPFCSTFVRRMVTAIGSFRVLVDGRGVVAASASGLDLGRGPSIGTGTLEVLAHPDHLGGAAGPHPLHDRRRVAGWSPPAGRVQR
jgi:GNAT superfamily N-acetyltransferase